MNAKRNRGLTEEAATTAIDQACRMLRLPTIRGQFPDLAEAASREQMSYRGFLAELLLAECDDRARRRSERRIKAAGFPREKSLRAFDYDANPNIDAATINTLATCEMGPQGPPALPDRRLGHGQVPSAHRTGHRGRDEGIPGQVRPGDQAGKRAGRGRRREAAGQDHRPLRTRRSFMH